MKVNFLVPIRRSTMSLSQASQEICQDITSKQKHKINSFVFFDLETTGFIKKHCMPRVTEVALVAVSRNNLKIPQAKMPRILSKLIFPVNPETVIPELVTNLTNISNHSLVDVKPFDLNIFCTVMHFLQRLPEPICFVAHNGNRFDFPILLKEFRDLGEDVPAEILSIDTFELFTDYFDFKPIKKGAKKTKQEVIVKEKCNSLFKDSWNDDELSAALDAVEKCESFEENVELQKIVPIDEKKEICMNRQRINEKSPDLQSMSREIVTPSRASKSPVNEKPENMKLPSIYKFMTGCSPDIEHYAESDCLSLIRCANLIGEEFIEYADERAKPLFTFGKNIQY